MDSGGWPLVKEGRILYEDVKKAAKRYGEAKEAFTLSLTDAGFGHWVRKPKEQDTFERPFWIKEME